MRITSLSLQDFRSYASAEVEFPEPISIVRGLIGRGKTTLAQAIQLSLTRQAEGTDPRGAGALDKVRLGAKKAVIGVTVEGKAGPVKIRTSYTPSGRDQKITAETAGMDEAFANYLEANKLRLSCAFDSDFFIAQKPEDQKAILAGLVMPQKYDFDEAIINLLAKHLRRLGWHPEQISQYLGGSEPLSLIDTIYKRVYDDRKEAKAVLNSIYVPPDPKKPEHTIEEINQELATLRAKASKEAKAVTRTGTARLGRLEAELQAAERALKTAIERYTAAKQERDKADNGILAGPALNKLKKTAANRAQWNLLETALEEGSKKLEAYVEAERVYKELKTEKVCPECTQPITPKFIDGKLAELAEAFDTANQLQQTRKKEQLDLGDIAGAEHVIAEHDKAVAAKLEATRRVTAAEEAVKTATTERDDLARAVEAEKANVAAAAPADTSALDAINKAISEWEGELGPAAQYQATLDQIERAKARRIEQEATVKDLESLCEYFGKDGVKATIIRENIDAFANLVNAVLAFWVFKADFQFEPYQFLVTGQYGQLPLKELSRGQKKFFAIALQCAIAIQSKIRCVVIDDGDVLVDADRIKLFQVVQWLIEANQLEQAIIILADGKTDPPKNPQPGVAYYRVDDGKVERALADSIRMGSMACGMA